MRAVLVLPGDGIGPRATDDEASVLAAVAPEPRVERSRIGALGEERRGVFESEHGSEAGTRRSGTLEVRTRVREVPE